MDFFLHLKWKKECLFVLFLKKKTTLNESCHILVDAVFGFGFKPPARPEFQHILSLMSDAKIPVVSIDVPSG